MKSSVRFAAFLLSAAMVVTASGCGGGSGGNQAEFPTYGTDSMEIGVFSSPAPTQEAYDECAEAGFTYVLIDQNYASLTSEGYREILNYCNNAGMKSIPMTFNENDQTDFTDVPGYAGKFFWDEPSYDNYDTIAEWVAGFEAKNGTDKLFYVNLFPFFSTNLGCDTYEEYLQGYVDKVLSKVHGEKWLSVDIYPLCRNTRESYIYDGYLYNLEASAQIALTNPDILVHYYVQTHGHGYVGNQYRNLESVADIRFQYNCAMAYGVKAFAAFTYPSQGGADFSIGQGLVKNTQVGSTWKTERTPVYDYVKQANEELKAWDEVYLSFNYKGTKAVIGSQNEHGYNSNFDMLAHNKEKLKGVRSVTATQDTLIGEFSNNGTRAYMITNFAEPSSGMTDKVVMTLEMGDKAQVYINGEMQVKEVVDNQLAVTLKSGEAAFVVIAN